MKFSDMIKAAPDPPGKEQNPEERPGIVKGKFAIAKADEDQMLAFGWANQPAHLGTVHGNLRRYPDDGWNEAVVQCAGRNNRADLWHCKRVTRIPLYASERKSPDGYENGAYFRMHEPEKTGRNPPKKKKQTGT